MSFTISGKAEAVVLPARLGASRLVVSMLVALLAGYKRWLSPWLPAACRFSPSCSVYAIGALQRYGALRGSWMAARRLGRCHPFNAGGFDPVP